MGKGGNSRLKVAEFFRKGVIALNFLYLILGSILLGYAQSFKDEGNLAASTAILVRGLSLRNVADMMLFAGIFTIIIALAGIIGAWIKYRKALVFYIISLLIVSFILMAVGSDLIYKDSNTMESEWVDKSNSAIERRVELMRNFDCCGFYLVTDSYQFSDCIHDLNQRTDLLSCSMATQAYLETNIYPVARGAIGIGVVEFLSLLVTIAVIFTSKDMKSEFYDNPFRDG